MNSFLKRKNVIPGGMLLIMLLCAFPLILLSESTGGYLPAPAQHFPEVKEKIICEENPVPTHIEKESHYVPLEKVAEITADIDKEHFLVNPLHLCTDNRGDIFIFDIKINEIFKFHKTLAFAKSFGNTGHGPGEYGNRGRVFGIRFSRDGYLCLSDMANRKFIFFDTGGNHKKDIKLPLSARSNGGFQPLINPDGSYYLLSGFDCTIDVHNIHDPGQHRRYSLLGPRDCGKSVLFKVRKQDRWGWRGLYIDNTFYDILPDGRLIVYLKHTSTVYIFKEEALVESFNIWPRGALETYKKKIGAAAERKPRKNELLLLYMFSGFFMDKDTGAHFYIQGWGEGKRKHLLYRFDLKGNLLSIYYTPQSVWFKEKRNNLFYGKHRDSILIYRPGTNRGK